MGIFVKLQKVYIGRRTKYQINVRRLATLNAQPKTTFSTHRTARHDVVLIFANESPLL